MQSPIKLIFLLLPSLLLFCSFFWKDLTRAEQHQEVFADNGHILEITFPTNVQKYLKKGTSVTRTAFSGVYVTDAGEKRIRGERIHQAGFTEYVFSLPEGSRFVGRMEKPKNDCKGKLSFRLENGYVVKEMGSLKAAFCQ